LAICQKIVEDHRGFLKLTSSPGEGTELSVWLPLR
jgi:signal transduction histidine kinase